MDNNINRIMVNTIVKKAIHDLKDDPERSVRNLVDMALQFADSRFQKEFYSVAKRLLDNENSRYYGLIKETVTKINEETLLTFGMNLGYNGLYEGATTIRRTEKKEGYNIPWTISLDISGGRVFEEHHHTIAQGEKLGIHSWCLFSNNSVRECMTLAKGYPDSAFVIFCGSNEESMNVLGNAEIIRNIAIMVPFDKEADVVCNMLRDAGFIYGLYYNYSDKDIDSIESGELLHDMEQLNPILSVLRPQSLRQTEARSRVTKWVTQARLDHQFKTIPWELYGDTMLIDSVISEQPIWVGFDKYGQLNTDQGVDRTYGLNIYVNDLPTVLQRAFPKQKGAK